METPSLNLQSIFEPQNYQASIQTMKLEQVLLSILRSALLHYIR